MDPLDVLHIKVRLLLIERDLSRIESVQSPMPVAPPKIPAPIQLAGLKSRLARGNQLEVRARMAGERVDAAHDIIESGIVALEQHAPQLEEYGSDLLNQIQRLSEPSNGGPALDGEEHPTTQEVQPPLGPNGGPRILNSSGAQ